MNHGGHLLEVKDLHTHFHTFEGTARAVDGVSFTLDKGEVLGVVGESGCGKSVTASSIMRLIPEPPGKIEKGEIIFDGMDLAALPMDRIRGIRGKRIAMIFQEPMTSLNPVYTIGDQLAEMFSLHEGLNKREALQRAVEILSRVNIPAPEKRLDEYPHQLSGGMRQRVMIAMAMSCNPEILIADEPTTALDVTVQAQILDLMLEMRETFGTAVMMITHDLGVIAEMADRVVVMYSGKVVESAATVELFQNPLHPYTHGLMGSIPKLGERVAQGRQRLMEIKGMVPNLYDLPKGCRFQDRCPRCMDRCRVKTPPLEDCGSEHMVRCWLMCEGGL